MDQIKVTQKKKNVLKMDKRTKSIVFSILSIIILIVFLFPLYWIIATSFKMEAEIFQYPPTLFPKNIVSDSYTKQLSGDFNMFNSFKNSFIISTGAMLISVLLSVPAAYGIARYKFKGRNFIELSFLLTQMIPGSVILTPLFIIFNNLGIINTQLAVVLADATIGIPFSVLILKPYFATIPDELDEAAQLDGANRFTIFTKVYLPIVAPGIVVSALFSFLYAWGDLAFGMTFIQEQTMRPITAGIFNFIGQYGTSWSNLTAFATVTIIPVLLIFIFMQKYIVAGLTDGAVKG